MGILGNLFGKKQNTSMTVAVPEDKGNEIFSDLVESLKIMVKKNEGYKLTKQGKENQHVSGMTVETYKIINTKGVAVYCHINEPAHNITVFKTILDFKNNIAECIDSNGVSKKYFIYDHGKKTTNQSYLKRITKTLKEVKKFNPHYERNLMP